MRIFKHKMTIIGLLLLLGIAALSVKSGAQTQGPRPNVFDGGNRWLITDFEDCNPTHPQWATQGICFLPYKSCGACGITGIWYSDTYPGWAGRYMQEGDRILMHGNWGNDVGSDSMVIELFSANEGSGQWTEWFNAGPYGTTVGNFLNARLRRVGKCQLPQNMDVSRMSQVDVERLPLEQLQRNVKPRMRRDGKQAEFPGDPEQVPLQEEKQYQDRQ